MIGTFERVLGAGQIIYRGAAEYVVLDTTVLPFAVARTLPRWVNIWQPLGQLLIWLQATKGWTERDTSWRWQLVKKARLRIVMYRQQNGICWWCSTEMSIDPFRINASGDEVHNQRYASIEHMLERKNGGSNARSNLVLAHANCNRNRHKRKWPHDPVYGTNQKAAHDGAAGGR